MIKTASIWIHGRVARTIIRDENGNVIRMSDGWNNIASAQMDVLDNWPTTTIETCRDDARKIELNKEWDKNNV